MNRLTQLGWAALTGAIAATTLTTAAVAGVNRFTDGTSTRVWIDGLDPGISYEYNIPGQDKIKSRTVNACGWIVASFSFGETPPSSVKIDADKDLVSAASAIDVSALPTVAHFCKNGVQVDVLGNELTLGEQQSSPFEDASGKFIFPGYTQNERQYIMYVGVPDVKKKKANACGIIAFKHDTADLAKDFTSFNFDGTAYTWAALSEVPEQKCKKYKDGTYRVLVPTDI